MPDTPTPAELARLAKEIAGSLSRSRSVRLTQQFFDDMKAIAAALSRLSQAEQDADQRAAAVLAAPGGLTVHCIRWPSACSERRVWKERADKAEQERDASDAVHERLRQAAHKLALYSMPPSDLTLSMSWGIERRKRQDELDAALGAFCVDFDERHKRSRQQRA